MILSFLFYAFLIYLAWKLVFNFIIPVYKTTKRVKKGFREMNERMRQQTETYQQSTGTTQQAKSNHDTPGEYIDFEEVKD